MADKEKNTSTSKLAAAPAKRLYRSQTDRVIAGVCGGLGAYLDLDPTLLRLGLIVITLFGGAGILVYFILWLVMPAGPDQAGKPEDIIRANAQEIKTTAESWASNQRLTNSRALWGLFFIVIGVLFLLQNFGFTLNLNLGKLWPLLIIALGFSVLTRRRA